MFNFIETFFFISLGITFVLILLLVYHVKQRISTLEQKSDTMFEIITNIVQEVTVVKNMSMNQAQMRPPPPPPPYNGEQDQNWFTHQPSVMQEQFIDKPMFGIHRPDFNVPLSNLKQNNDDDDDEDSDDEDSDDEDSDDEDSDDEDSDDSDDEDSDEEEDSDNSDDEDKPAQNNIKIINLNATEPNLESVLIQASELTNLDMNSDLPENEIDIDSILESTNIQNIEVLSEESRRISDDSAPSSDDSMVIVNGSSAPTIHVNKLNESNANNSETPNKERSATSDIYRKMSISALKALVVSKGLATDTSKMKKPDIIALLDTLVE